MIINIKRAFHSEIDDLKSLFLGLVLIPLLWFLLGWTPEVLTIGHDAVALQAPQLQRLLQSAGDWTQTLYRVDTQGGIKIHDIYGTLPIQQIFALLGLTVTSSINLTVFFIQILYAFFCVRACLDLNKTWKNYTPLPIVYRGLMIVIFSFAPILGWKLIYGHTHLLLGSFAYLVAFSLLLSVYLGRTTFTLLLLSSIALIHSFTSNGQQTLLYSFTFGLPLFIGVFISVYSYSINKLSYLTIGILFLFFLSTFMISMPHLYPMLSSAFSTDSSRSLNSSSIIYSYITANWLDWITSIPWTTSFLPLTRSPIFFHEINYPFGPILLFLFFIPKKRRQILFFGAFFTILAVLAFSMNWTPLSNLIALAIPYSNNFRVPERSMLILSLILPILSIAGLWYRTSRRLEVHSEDFKFAFFISIFLLTLIGALAPTLRESLLWIFSILFLFFFRLEKPLNSIWTFSIWLTITLGSFYSFQERLILPFFSLESYSKQLAEIGRFSINQHPNLSSPLSRISIDPNISSYFGVNSHYFMKLSTINGYWVPQKRFVELSLALMNAPYHPSFNNFNFNSKIPEHSILALLYNICCELTFENSNLLIKKLPPTLGSAWFSQKIIPVPSIQALIAQFHNNRNLLIDALKQETWIVSTDSVFNQILVPTSYSDECKYSEVHQINALWDTQSIHLKVKNNGNSCPLNVSMNYSPILSAYASMSDQRKLPLTLFPSYGAITGLIVPAKTEEITITASQSNSLIPTTAFYFGIGFWCLSGILLFTSFSRRD